jgi:D-serine deaminase-like pyridoxal phosphate-dependent protein
VIGRGLEDLLTPALVLDLDRAQANVRTMAERMAGVDAGLRPHIKAHKSPELARMQIDAGAIGVTVATAREALAMARGGIADVLIANQVVSPAAISILVEAARIATVRVCVDDAGNVQALGDAARAAAVELGVLIEVDVGLGRGGVRSIGDVMPLARLVHGTSDLRFDGLFGYEGHCVSEPDPVLRADEARRSMEVLASAVRECRAGGLDVSIVSAGATGTFEMTGNAPEVTEVQAGSYVFMDTFHAPLVEGFEQSLTVLSTVIGRHGNLAVLDAGRKSVDVSLRPLAGPDPGSVVEFVHEEHVGLRYETEAPHAIGDLVRLVPGYVPTTVNLFGTYHVIRDDRVVAVWPVLARHGDP